MNETRILIVHPDSSARTLLTSMLQTLSVHLEEADSDRAAARRLERGGVELVVAGVEPDDPDALELLHYVKRKMSGLPMILLFSVGDAERTREARQRGADAVLRFPLPATQLRAAVAQALGRTELVPRASSLSGQGNGNGNGNGHATAAVTPPPTATVAADAGHGWTVLSGPVPPAPGGWSPPTRREAAVLVGEDESLRQAIELAETIATTRAPVLIQGESGTGKSLVARTMHQQGPRHHGPFVELRCLPDTGPEVDRQLFGERPLLGPAVAGEVERARGGTLYIEDVASLSPEVQAKLLRLLRDGEYEPVGSPRPERADVRLVLGTREDLLDRVDRGDFRQDLSIRIGVVTLKLPPLRHRGADIERLAEHFRSRAARRAERPVTGFSTSALGVMRRYHWPGNVQELEAAVERAVLLCRGRLIEPTDLGLASASHASAFSTRPGGDRRAAGGQIRPLKEALEEPEKRIILEALEALGWNRQETARMLDINRTTLYKKMKKYGLLLDEPAWAG